MMKVFGLTVVSLVLLNSCGNIETPFQGNPAVSTFAEISPYCKLDGKGVYPSAVVIASKGNDGEHDYASGGGCIFRPLGEAWAAARNQTAMAWDKAKIEEVTPVPRTDVSYLFRVKYGAGPVDWIMEWYHSVLEGDLREPKKVLIRYQKVQGTKFIQFWQGAIEMTSVTEKISALQMRNEILAKRQDPDTAAQAISDLLNRIRVASSSLDASLSSR
jgi:hypothetical protein